jgi:tRNA threonylcarbamoyladenosine biosynthesis protein TsaE
MKVLQEFQVRSIEDLDSVASAIIELAGRYNIFLLEGGLGAGKTTLVKSVLKGLGSSDLVHSPTFSLIHSYELPDGLPWKKVWHGDFYRLERIEEALDIGIEEYLWGENPIFLEWPNLIESFCPNTSLKVSIQMLDDSSRNIVISSL